jgi:5-methylcytosine-specific restriction endonuclease McrA
MRLEIVLLLVVGLLMANIYTDGKFLKQLLSYKKYYQMAGIAFGGLMLYWLLKKNPRGAHEMVRTSHEYLKYLPIDQNASSMITPILDFTTKQEMVHNGGGGMLPNSLMNVFARDPMAPPTRHQESKLMNSGTAGMANGQKTKRSVSETKKKFVASRQNWHCGDCQEQLSAWFEVDHKMRLEYGGSNHIDNLVALCRECHGKKTTIENL